MRATRDDCLRSTLARCSNSQPPPTIPASQPAAAHLMGWVVLRVLLMRLRTAILANPLLSVSKGWNRGFLLVYYFLGIRCRSSVTRNRNRRGVVNEFLFNYTRGRGCGSHNWSFRSVCVWNCKASINYE